MRQIVLEQPGQFLEQIAVPMEANPGEALVRVHRIGVCGTDLHALPAASPSSLIHGFSVMSSVWK